MTSNKDEASLVIRLKATMGFSTERARRVVQQVKQEGWEKVNGQHQGHRSVGGQYDK